MHTVERAFRGGWEIVRVSAPAQSDGDGGAGSEEAVTAALGAEVYIGWGVPLGVARAAQGSLRWAHTATAGVGGSITPEFEQTGAILTSSRGVYAEPMADWVVTAIGVLARGFHVAMAAQREGRWAKDVFTDGTVVVKEISALRVGVVGLGSVGRAVAKRCAALGMQVNGIRQNVGARRPAGIEWVGGPGDMLPLAGKSDILVIALPYTEQTAGIVSAEVLGALPSGAFVINVARGALVDEAALLEHLDSGRLGGCALDVFLSEPLPRSHAFWQHSKVLMSPHVSGVSSRYWERETDLIVENVTRYLRGRRLKNVVDITLGY